MAIKPFNTVDLEGVIVYDLQKDTLLYADEIKVKFELMPFFRNYFIFHQIKLVDADIYLKHSEENGNNFDFLIDAFKSQKNKEKKDNLFHFGTIQTYNCRFRYESDKQRKKVGNFDVSDIEISELNSRITIYYFAKKNCVASIKKLSFNEKSGLKLNSLQTDVAFDSTGLRLMNVLIEMPKSKIQSDSISLVCDSLADFKEFNSKVKLYAQLNPTTFTPSDISAFVPALKRVNTTISATGTACGTVDDLKFSQWNIAFGNNSSLRGNFDVTGLPNIGQTYIHASVSKLHTTRNDVENLISDIKNAPFLLPKNLRNITHLDFVGQVSGYPHDFVTNGTFSTNVGTLVADFLLNTDRADDQYIFEGSLKSDKFNLKQLTNNEKLGSIVFNVDVKGSQNIGDKEVDCHTKGVVSSFEFNNYKYENIVLDGLYENRKFNGEISLDDPNGNVAIDGLIDFSDEIPFYNFEAKVRDWNPYGMNLLKKYPDLFLSFDINTDIEGSKLDNIKGNASAKDITINNGDKSLSIDLFTINSDISDTLSSIIVTSDYLYGVIEGRYSFSTFVSGFKYIASEYVPILHLSEKQKSEGSVNNFDFDLNVSNMDKICDLFDLNFSTSSNFNIFGFYDDKTRKFRLRSIIPDLRFKKMQFSSVLISCENPDDAISLAVDAHLEKLRPVSTNSFGLFFRAWAKNDTLTTNFQWQNNEEKLYAGELSGITALSKKNDRIFTSTAIQQSNIIFADTVWTMHPSEIITEGDRIKINKFKFGRENEHIFLDGVISKAETDSLLVDVKNVRLGYLDQFLNMNNFSIDGKVSGGGMVYSMLKNPEFSADLSVKDFEFNKSVWGDVHFLTDWDKERESMVTDIKVFTETDSIAHITGDIYPKRKIDLDLNIDANGLKLDFIGVFMQNILQNMRGKAYADDLKMTGPLTRPSFDGNVYIENGNFCVDFLKTKYHFSDSLYITPTSFALKNVKLYDEENNFGTVSGNITHNLFRDWEYNISGDCKNILGLNTQEGDNEMFYGKMYGTGNVLIYGTADQVNFDIGMRTEDNSKLVIPISDSSTASENTFVTFVKTDTINTQNRRRPSSQQIQMANSDSKIVLNLQVEALPTCEVQLILDKDAGDVIKANGQGNLRMEYKKGELKLYGEYALDKGFYNFSLQEIIRRNFKIKEGSTAKWTGDPFNPIINIEAYYTTMASLLDLLDEAMLTDVKKLTVPVNCLLYITGELSQPNIRFNIELPNSEDDVERQVRNVINSDEMMNREVLYLLSVSKFYKPDYMATNSTSSDDFSSFLCSTVSAELNRWLSQINENLSMGVNYKSSSSNEMESTEFGVELGATVLNNRLVLNGNVGYRNDITSSTNFVGDFDVEYKLNRSGKLRVKAYTHSNDKYYDKNPTTQGAGFMYKEDFDTFGSLIRDYKTRIANRKEKNKQKKQEKQELKATKKE